MNKIILIFLACLCCTMSMAQTTPTGLKKYSNHFPKLPPLTVDFMIDLFHHSQPHLMQMTPDCKQKEDTLRSQSIMLRHKEQDMKSQ